ncbi:MAG: glycogen/starch/alpha-glucan phosphorylase [Pseudolabrys sp.]|nr:glycogen/starch/alpha-glucan phosphorylase [Pseudolabrys sp.]
MQHARRRPSTVSPLTSEESALCDAICAKLVYGLGRTPEKASLNDWYQATVLSLRDRLVDRWIEEQHEIRRFRRKRVYYLSIEFLIGRLLLDTLRNLRLTETARRALAAFDVDLDALSKVEPDAALGNGGLGRLAACFMDSMAALGIPAYGYGIRYDHGLFEQRIEHGWQREYPEDWLARGNPWEFANHDTRYTIGFGGAVEYLGGNDATARAVWHPAETVLALPYDTLIGGWRGRHVNVLRLWSARAASPLQLAALNHGDLIGASAASMQAEAISRVLYPNDSTPGGQELRLRQEYFFTSASLQDLVRRHLEEYGTLDTLPDHAAVQLNDTHPAIAVAELMRLLIDEHGYGWDHAWSITRSTLAYTNHTLLPEALETWPVELVDRLLPRHLQIIYLINWLHLSALKKAGHTDAALLADVSLVQENGTKSVRMAHLAFVGTHCVNGVSALHTDLLRKTIFNNLARLTPTRIVNETNGIAFRRWLFGANPPLTNLLVRTLGEDVLDDTSALSKLETLIDEPNFITLYRNARAENKERLAQLVQTATGVRIRSDALFDVHVKRIHEYKRQLLNILEAIALFQAIRSAPHENWVPRVKIFAGKAAVGYERAKLIIKLINDVAAVVNADPVVGDRLKIVFLPNYNVSLAEQIIPAADLSEQISTAGMEASGTGNMKLALNGSLTIGTLDGANIEIRDHVGADNIIIFGMTAAEVAERQRTRFTGAEAMSASPRLAAAVDGLAKGVFSPDDPNRYGPLVEALASYDRFMVAADFDAYWDAQRSVDRLWRNPLQWWRIAILNTARMTWFSSDRAIRDYARDIWNLSLS